MCGQIRNTIGTPGQTAVAAPLPPLRGPGKSAAATSERQFEGLLAKCLKQTRAFEAGECLITEGDPSRELCRVVAGELAASQKTPDGSQPVLAFYYPNDLLMPTAPGESWTHSVRALSDGQLEIYRLDAVHKACQADGRLAYQLFLAACQVLSERMEQSARLRSLSVEGRFAAFLLDAGGRIGTAQGPDLTLSLPMSRTDIASYLGLRTETLSRIIRRWRDRGLIRLESSRRVVIRDGKQLEALAQDVATCAPSPT